MALDPRQFLEELAAKLTRLVNQYRDGVVEIIELRIALHARQNDPPKGLRALVAGKALRDKDYRTA